jgi:shikimate dehydrogenase
MTALVLGAGGAARAVAYALASAGVKSVGVWNRHPERAERLVSDLAPLFDAVEMTAVERPELASAELLVNATALGMADGMGSEGADSASGGGVFKELCFSADELDDRHIVVDLVYRAGGTELVRAARERGVPYVDGIDVLVHQGAESFRIWTGQEPSLEAMRRGAGDGT